MWQRNGEFMRIQGYRGFKVSPPVDFQFRITDYAVLQRIVETQRLKNLTKPNDSIPSLDLFDAEVVQSWMGVPLIKEDNVIGLFIFTQDVPNRFTTRQEQQVVSILASQVAIAIENSNLQRESEFEHQRLFTILSTLPTGVLVLDPNTLKPQQHNNLLEELLGQPVNYDEPFNAERYNLYRTGTELFFPDSELPIYEIQLGKRLAYADDLSIKRDTGDIDIKMSAAPILNKDNDVFSIVAVFENITDLRSMENTMQDNLRETVLLYETQRSLNDSNILDELLDSMITPLAMQQPTDAYIFLNDKKNNLLELVRFLSYPLENVQTLRPILKNAVLHIDNVQGAMAIDEATRQMLTNMDVGSVMVLPLYSRDRQQPLGWMVMVDTRPEAFTANQKRILTTISELASAALENSILITDLRETIKKLQ